MLDATRMLRDSGYRIYATGGTAAFLAENGIESQTVHWPDSDKKPNVLDILREHRVDLVINIPKNYSSREIDNGFAIRRSAIDYNIPLITNARLAGAFIYALCRIGIDGLAVKPWNEY